MPPKAAPKPIPRGRPKKPPMGIPAWGWIIGGVIGLLIGYTLLKSSSATSTPPSDGGSGGAINPDTAPTSSAPTPDIPWDEILSAMGLRGGGTGTFPGSTTETSTSQQNAIDAANQAGPQAPTLPAGSFIDPNTGTNINLAGMPTNTSYADLGVTPSPITGPDPVANIQGPGPLPALSTVTPSYNAGATPAPSVAPYLQTGAQAIKSGGAYSFGAGGKQ